MKRQFLAGLVITLFCSATAALSDPIVCGGIADPPCPDGTACFDDPDDGCSPLCGGADCRGICAGVPTLSCGGIAQIACPVGLTCIDDPGDKCRPDCGGADCSGICVQSEGSLCDGIAGLTCPTGYTCADSSGDGCHPACGGADCGGTCVRPAPPSCGGFAGFPCPAGLVCVDDPTDDCDNDCNGADCGGICVDPAGFTGCADALAPSCAGVCPAGSYCAATSGQSEGCSCTPCSGVPGHGIDLVWSDATSMTWDPLPCASWYNCYRMTAHALQDSNGDGLADDYGSCIGTDLSIPVAIDSSEPPQGMLHFYLITGENAVGEGAAGFGGAMQMRQIQSPCPPSADSATDMDP